MMASRKDELVWRRRRRRQEGGEKGGKGEFTERKKADAPLLLSLIPVDPFSKKVPI